MKKIAVFPGSFDPLTIGHESIVRRALELFDEIIIAVGANALKKNFYSLQTRKEIIKKVFENEPRVRVEHYEGLTVDYCKSNGAGFILRGLRTAADFEFERGVAQVNLKLVPEIETVFLLTLPEYVMVTSSIVREVHRHGGNVEQFIPEQITI